MAQELVSDDLNELSPRERRHARTQQAILDAARAIINEQGVDKLSIRAIADRIDYSPAGLYEYFGSKEEIVGAVCIQGHRMLKRYMAAVDMALPVDKYIVELGMAYIRFATRNPDYFLLMFTTFSSDPNLVQDGKTVPPVGMMEEDSSFPILLAATERAIIEGIIQPPAPMGVLETAYALWAMVHGIAMLRITNLKKFRLDFETVDRLAMAAHIHGYRN